MRWTRRGAAAGERACSGLAARRTACSDAAVHFFSCPNRSRRSCRCAGGPLMLAPCSRALGASLAGGGRQARARRRSAEQQGSWKERCSARAPARGRPPSDAGAGSRSPEAPPLGAQTAGCAVFGGAAPFSFDPRGLRGSPGRALSLSSHPTRPRRARADHNAQLASASSAASNRRVSERRRTKRSQLLFSLNVQHRSRGPFHAALPRVLARRRRRRHPALLQSACPAAAAQAAPVRAQGPSSCPGLLLFSQQPLPFPLPRAPGRPPDPGAGRAMAKLIDLEELEAELDRTRGRFDAWAKGRVQVAAECRGNHAYRLQEASSKIAGLEGRYATLKSAAEGVAQRLAEEGGEMETLGGIAASLHSERDSLAKKLQSLQRSLAQDQAEAASREAGQRDAAAARERTLGALDAALATYESRLGLQFQQGTEELLMTLTQARATPRRAFPSPTLSHPRTPRGSKPPASALGRACACASAVVNANPPKHPSAPPADRRRGSGAAVPVRRQGAGGQSVRGDALRAGGGRHPAAAGRAQRVAGLRRLRQGRAPGVGAASARGVTPCALHRSQHPRPHPSCK